MGMEEAKYKEVSDILSANGVAVMENEGFRRMNGKGRMEPVDVTDMLKDTGVTPMEYMAEWTDRLKKKLSDLQEAAEAEYEELKESDIRTPFRRETFQHEDVEKMSDWALPDDRWFSRFRFAQNPIDDSFVLVISMAPGKIGAIPMSGNVQGLVSAIAAKCSVAEPMTPGKYSNLYDELTRGFNDTVQGVVDRYRSREFVEPVDFVRHLSMHIPHCMLKKLSWSFMYQYVTKTIGDREKVFHVPVALRLEGQGGKQTPIEFMANYINLLVSQPKMLCKMPKVFTNDPNEPALCYLDLDSICKEGPCPTWDQYMKRYRPDHAEAFKAFMYSIFVADNTSRQALNIVDNGYTGKSFVMNCVQDVLGEELCTALQKDSLANQFSLAKVWDKRLVTIGDNKNKNILMSEKLHMMTGHDYADIEMKGKNSFHSRLQCKVIISGNTTLTIHPDAVHETSRLIQISPVMTEEILKEFCALDENGNVRRRSNGTPVFLGDPSFGVRLKKEFSCFLTKCREAYRRLCPNGADIIISDEMFDEMMSLAPTETFTVADFFDRNFELADGNVMPVRDFDVLYRSRLESYLDNGAKKPPFDFAEFREYVDKRFERKVRFGVTRKVGGKSMRVHVGLRAKPAEESVNLYQYDASGDRPGDQWEGAV
jgi:hypothetical protein